MADMGGISVATCSRIIKRVSAAIVTLRPEFVNFPNTSEEQENVKMEFYNISRFPNVLGCIDCTHVKIQSPGETSRLNFITLTSQHFTQNKLCRFVCFFKVAMMQSYSGTGRDTCP